MAFGVYDFTGTRAVPVEDDWSFSLTWKAGADAATAVPVNLTGWAAVFEVWQDPSGRTLLYSAPCTLGGAAGTIAAAAGHATLSALPRGTLYYTLVVTSPAGVRRTLLRGQYFTL
jgi:hypothetical protein